MHTLQLAHELSPWRKNREALFVPMSGQGQARRWRARGPSVDSSTLVGDEENIPLLKPMDIAEIPSRPSQSGVNANQFIKLALCA